MTINRIVLWSQIEFLCIFKIKHHNLKKCWPYGEKCWPYVDLFLRLCPQSYRWYIFLCHLRVLWWERVRRTALHPYINFFPQSVLFIVPCINCEYLHNCSCCDFCLECHPSFVLQSHQILQGPMLFSLFSESFSSWSLILPPLNSGPY